MAQGGFPQGQMPGYLTCTCSQGRPHR
jgi:hypothetical protein